MAAQTKSAEEKAGDGESDTDSEDKEEEEREQSVGSKARKRQAKEDMEEWPVGMNESSEDVSGSCLRINPTVSGKQNTNTSNPAVQLPVLRQLKGNNIKMQMWPIYWGSRARIGISGVCVFGVCINVDVGIKDTETAAHTANNML